MKKRNRILLMALMILGLSGFKSLQAQTQVGQDIDGEAANDNFGFSVSLSSDGSTVAIGAYLSSGNGSQSGNVRVYQNISGIWSQIGTDINGQAANDMNGYSVCLSSDGSILAIGAIGNDGNGSNAGSVSIYQNISGTWTQIGTDIEGEATNDYFGKSISLSSDGSIVAIGAIGNNGNGSDAGSVSIFQNNSGTWTQIGADIDGEAANDKSGYSVSLSSDGTIVAIGANQNDGNGNDAGHTRVYQNISGAWIQIGADIDGEAAGDNSGTSVSLSSDGSIVAIGAHKNDGNGSNAGQVRIFKNISGTWTQIGADIDGEAVDDWSGLSVSLSSNGSIVAIGAIDNDGNGNNAGHTRIYQNITGVWTQVGADIDGEAYGDNSGRSVSLSSDGSIVAIGAPLNNGNASHAGQVRVYTLLPIITNQAVNQSNICSGSNVFFSISGENIDTYQWQVNEGSGFVDITNGGVYSGATTDTLYITDVTLAINNYQYRCNVTNTIGNATSDTVILTTDYEAPVTPTLTDITGECSVTVTPPTTTDNCAGTITGTTTDSSTYTTQGTHVITWTFDDGNGNSIDVNQNVILDDVTDPTIICLGNQTINLNGGETTYTISGTEFDPTNSDDNCGVESVINDFNSLSTLDGAEIPIGTTTILWTVTDIAGNESTCNFDVTVNEFVGIQKLEEHGVLIYPNPTKQFVNIIIPNSILANEISIFDITGQKVFENKTISNNTLIDISKFQTGTYFVRIISTEKIITKKLIIK